MMRWLQIGNEVVVLQYKEHDGKITPVHLQVMPVGVWNNILKRKRDEEIH
jgi:hypothetical protein